MPCPSVVTDPTYGNLALDLAWLTSYPNGNTQDSITINTAGPGPNGNQGVNFPITGYFEATYRITPTIADSTNYPLSSYWSWGFNTDANGPIEIDGIETYGSNFGSFDAATHQWAAGNNPPGSGYLWQGTGSLPSGTNYDPTQYTVYAWRVTSNGSSAMQVCAYVNNVFVACRSPAPTSAQYNQRQFDILGNGGFTASLSQNTHMYVKQVRNFECAGWATGSCFGAVLGGAP